MILIDKYAYCNKIQGISPMEKVTFSIGTLIICLAVNSLLVDGLVIALMALLLIFYVGIPSKFYCKMMFLPISFLLLGLLGIALDMSSQQSNFVSSLPLGKYYLGFTEQGLHTANILFFRALASVSCLYYLSLTTPIVEIIAVLRKAKMPELFLELMSLIYRFIFVLLETADKIYLAQSSRLGYADLKKSYSSLGHLISNLFIRAFKRSNDLYSALEARGYQGSLRVMEKKYKISSKNIFLIFIWLIILILTANIR